MNYPTKVYPGGVATEDDEYPDEIRWTFQVEAGGQSGTSSGFFPIGTSEETAARAIYRMLESDPLLIEGVPAAHTGPVGGGGGGAPADGPSSAGSGEGPPPPPKYKAPDEEEDGFGL